MPIQPESGSEIVITCASNNVNANLQTRQQCKTSKYSTFGASWTLGAAHFTVLGLCRFVSEEFDHNDLTSIGNIVEKITYEKGCTYTAVDLKQEAEPLIYVVTPTYPRREQV